MKYNNNVMTIKLNFTKIIEISICNEKNAVEFVKSSNLFYSNI